MPSVEAMIQARREQLEREAANGLNASSAAGSAIIHQLIPKVATEITRRLNDWPKGAPKPRWSFAFEALRPEIAACLGLRAAFNILLECGTSGSGLKQQLLFRSVGRAVLEEAVLLNKAKHDLQVAQQLKKLARTRDSAESKLQVARKLFNLKKFVATSECIVIGAAFMSCVSAVSDAITHESVIAKRGRKLITNVVYKLNTATIDWIEEFQRRMPEYRPILMPLDVPPIDWTGPEGGSYGSNMIAASSLLLNYEDPEQVENIKAPSKYLDAVNIAQRTAWAINENVLEVAETLWARGTPVPCLPMRDRPPKTPPCPPDADDDAKRAWKREAVHRIEAEYARVTGCALFGRQLVFARTFAGDGKFWFPGALDFRGRFYYRGNLSVQGDDFQRGILCFADARPLGGPDAVRWLKIHLANCYGIDKAPFDVRLRWVEENEAAIIECATDPIENLWWTTADSPWQFLAAILDYWGYKQDGYKFVSRIPIGMDGSNNGLQLYSLLVRDKALAVATNVLPTEKPNDIYREVAARVTMTTKNSQRPPEAEAGVSWMLETLFPDGIPRSVTKRPVMTLAYGVTQFSTRKYVLDSIHEECKKRKVKMPSCNQYAALQFMGDSVWDAIQQGADSAVSCMRWISDLAERVAKKCGKPMTWEAPSGFPVHHWYQKEKTRTLFTTLGTGVRALGIAEKRQQIVCYDKEDSPNVKTMASAAPPNFIHSLDAAVLVETVLGCYSRGVENFALVHDSFGVSAADAPVLAEEIRQAIVRVFKYDPLEALAKSVESQLGEPVERFQRLDEFNVSEVLNSEYIFA